MLRIICRETNYELTQVNGACHEDLKTFDVDAPEVEKWLTAFYGKTGVWATRSILGVEFRPVEAPDA